MADFVLHLEVRATRTGRRVVSRRLSHAGGAPVPVGDGDRDEAVEEMLAVVRTALRLVGEDADALAVEVGSSWG